MELVDINHDDPQSIRRWRCRCPRCGYIYIPRPDEICESIPCPRCGAMMAREL